MSRVRRVSRVSKGQAEPEVVEPVDEELDEEDDVPETPDEPLEGETTEQAAERIIAKYRSRAKTPGKAIRAFCVECVGGMVRDVTRCTARKCVLYPFRHGHNPFHGRAGKPNPSAKKKS